MNNSDCSLLFLAPHVESSELDVIQSYVSIKPVLESDLNADGLQGRLILVRGVDLSLLNIGSIESPVQRHLLATASWLLIMPPFKLNRRGQVSGYSELHVVSQELSYRVTRARVDHYLTKIVPLEILSSGAVELEDAIPLLWNENDLPVLIQGAASSARANVLFTTLELGRLSAHTEPSHVEKLIITLGEQTKKTADMLENARSRSKALTNAENQDQALRAVLLAVLQRISSTPILRAALEDEALQILRSAPSEAQVSLAIAQLEKDGVLHENDGEYDVDIVLLRKTCRVNNMEAFARRTLFER